VLPDNYHESSYPVAVYRWHAENSTDRPVTVSVLLSWTNMIGWFRTFTRDFKGAPSQGPSLSHKTPIPFQPFEKKDHTRHVSRADSPPASV